MKVNNLYGEFADESFRKEAIAFCNSAKERLQKNLTKELKINGLSTRSDEIYNAIKWWEKRKTEFGS